MPHGFEVYPIVNADATKVMRQITLHVRIKRATELKARLWVGTRLIELAALIMGCNLDIEATEDKGG